MPKRETDNVCKFLAEKYPEAFVSWLSGMIDGIEPSQPVEPLKTELSIEPIRADFLAFLRTADVILHIEFQLDPDADPPMPLRLLDYAVRLHRHYRLPVVQIVILLRDGPKAREMPDSYEFGMTRHAFHVVRLWEVDADDMLQHPALLPLAVLAKADDPEKLLRKVAEKTATITDAAQRSDVRAASFILAGLRFPENLIRRLLKEDTMRESVTYQAILQEGQQIGIQQGLLQGETTLVLGQLTRRFGKLSAIEQNQIKKLSLEQLEALSLALLEFQTKADLKAWLKAK